MLKHKVNMFELYCNALELSGITLILLLTLAIQFIFREIPCPLCLLQRVGLICVTLGFLLNLRFTPHPRHYAIIILSALFTSFVALRHIAINLHNPEGGFGSAIFGLHLYTWSFIIAMCILIAATLIMTIERKYLPVNKNTKIRTITKIMLSLTILILVINIVVLANCLLT